MANQIIIILQFYNAVFREKIIGKNIANFIIMPEMLALIIIRYERRIL